ncbi:MAG: (d)CMP kinase [Oscillospiraceae bacterium]|nr:(d)CMP kinase [Oscillospiraceae bacterium]MDY4191127.1 (d)CMP kinase [Oscillospiraceae bacterium]
MVSVAIDGPAGAGKSTIARALAGRLGYIYVDTGALYRSVGLYVLESGRDTADPAQVSACLDEICIELKFIEGEQRVLLGGRDVSERIRTPEVSMAASRVSAVPAVRSFLFDLQRNMGKTNSIVMDGRDIGTVVLPDADVKIFLTASPEKRAQRRWKELREKGEQVTLQQVLEDVIQRDYNDSHRETAPLRQAEDAVLIDTSELTLEESIEALYRTVRERLDLPEGEENR